MASLSTWAFTEAVDERDQARFASAAASAEERIQNRLETHTAVLLATRGMLVVEPDLDARGFRRFTDQIELRTRYPALRALGFAARRSTRPDADPQSQIEAWPAASSPEHYPVVYAEPSGPPEDPELGFDMATEPIRAETMDRARDTGLPAASKAVSLAADGSELGFLQFVPVYRDGFVPATVEERRDALVGFVYGAFRMDQLFADLLGAERPPRVAFDVYDDDATPLYRSPVRQVATPRFETERTVWVAGRSWTVVMREDAGIAAGSQRHLLPYVFGTGILVSFVLFAFAESRARGREALRLQARVLESMGEGVSVSDESGVILYTNPAEDRMFGYAPGELIGQHVTVQNHYEPAENEAMVAEVIASLRSDGTWSGEFCNRKKDGTPFVTFARITALDAAGDTYLVCVQEDITARKHAEGERTELLRRERSARADAEAANRAKDEFLALLGHELRNPLSPIVTALEIMRLRGVVGADRELQLIGRQVRHLTRLVDDLLDVSRITRGKVRLDKRPLELAEVVGKAVEMASPLLERGRHVLVVDVPRHGLAVEADEVRLSQVVANLLTNAAKFTPQSGHIRVRAEADDGEIVLRVRDDGIGIAPELLPRVFEAFTQGERTIDRSQGGLGIGLNLVRSLVELHGGRVEAHSEGLGKGSEFVVRLPRRDLGPDARPPVCNSTPKPGERKRVLVVDDNEDAAHTLVGLLQSVGHDVVVAHDGPRALELASGFVPEVAILDIGLPVMDGYELAERLRERGDIRLIAVTGYGREHDRARARAAGFHRHFVKPVEPSALLLAVGDDSIASDTAPS